MESASAENHSEVGEGDEEDLSDMVD